MKFENKKIWIIGASSGIGAALAHELAAQGATLALSARRENELNELNAKLGGKHLVMPFDVADFAGFEAATNNLKAKWAEIDSILFMAATYTPGNVFQLKHDKVKTVVDVNLMSAFYLAELVLPWLIEQQKGQLVLCASVAGYRGLPTGQPYGMTKAALINLAESIHCEMQIKCPQIDIKIISPGFVRTPLTDKNDFKMPMIIEPEQAAKSIAAGLLRKNFEIHFPRKFTNIMKLLEILPYPLYFWLVKKMV
jgi:short-subunit dehydrogenase